jgi:archaeal holliday junction resolvase (hjc)
MKIHIKRDFGNTGENLATDYLEKQGYTILERNFYCKQGEIDIIAKDKNEIVFIEVKSRSNKLFGIPSEAVTKQKIKHLFRTARYFLYKNKMINEYIRFDVVEILIKSGKFNINHIKQIV